MSEVLLDALLDSLIIFPFVFLIYVFMEGIENFTHKEKIEYALKGNFAPILSSGLGVIPECGFSVMCAKLFDNGLIAIGTLIAAFLTTSDEGLVLLASSGVDIEIIIKLILCKVVFAIVVGIIFNFLLSKFNNTHVCSDRDDCIQCGEHHKKWYDKYILHPLCHTIKVFIFILIVNIVLGSIIFLVGEDKIVEFAKGKENWQPLITGLIGLIPNCSSSIILAQGYIDNMISFSALLTGLSTNAGVGLMVLFRGGKVKKAFLIMGLLFLTGVFLGYITLLMGI